MIAPEFTPERISGHMQSQKRFWEHWRFEPWASGSLRGARRKTRFIKHGILGPIAQYYAWDYIVWAPGTPADRQALWESVAPIPEVMTQRFVMLQPEREERRIRSFAFGLKGYAEFLTCWPGRKISPRDKARLRDIIFLLDAALALPLDAEYPPAPENS